MCDKSIWTQAVHAGERLSLLDAKPVTTPIYAAVGYTYPQMAQLDAVFAGERPGYVYTRFGNPTNSALEAAIATLEGGEDAVAFGSGMAAIHATCLAAGARAGATVLAARDLYGATYALLARFFATLGVTAHFVDMADLPAVAHAAQEVRPDILLCEVISNPLLKLADVAALAEIVRPYGTRVIVDNTFATPYLYQPLAHGADYVVHSLTKYLAGHDDVLAGVVVGARDKMVGVRDALKAVGGNLGQFEAYLALRGIKTFPLRMRQHCAGAAIVAAWLERHPAVARVYYPGLASHPQHALAKRLFGERGAGGVVAFDLRDADQGRVFRFFEALQLVLPATTLGDVYSLVLYPAHSSHRTMTPEERAAAVVGDGLVRLSVGIEDPKDIIADLAQALERI